MASTITVFRQSAGQYYQIVVDLISGVLAVNPDSTTTGELDCYIKITTTIRKTDGTAFSEVVVRNLSDVPPGFSPASTFSELIGQYVDYFLTTAEYGMSSSSSSTESSDSSDSTEIRSSSSSSSSMGYSQSSSSSSSSSSHH